MNSIRDLDPRRGSILWVLLAVLVPVALVTALAILWIEHRRTSPAEASGSPKDVPSLFRQDNGDVDWNLEPRSGGESLRSSEELARRIEIAAVRVDRREPLRSQAAVRQITEKMEDPVWLGIGDAFEAVYPPATLRRVGSVTVLFDWRGEEHRLLVPTDSVEDITRSDEDGSGEEVPPEEEVPERVVIPADEESTVTVSSEEREVVSQSYEKILRDDVAFRPYRNPSTGQSDGLEIQSLRPSSLPARRGFQQGDVIRTIDDFPITSQSAAIHYLRNLQGQSVSVLVLRRGRHHRLTFRIE